MTATNQDEFLNEIRVAFVGRTHYPNTLAALVLGCVRLFPFLLEFLEVLVDLLSRNVIYIEDWLKGISTKEATDDIRIIYVPHLAGIFLVTHKQLFDGEISYYSLETKAVATKPSNEFSKELLQGPAVAYISFRQLLAYIDKMMNISDQPGDTTCMPE